MNPTDVLKDRKVLLVDDEPDILESLTELLDMCLIDTAHDFRTAERFLREGSNYDLAVLDIMGVDGYTLLDLACRKNIPAIMLTAHALNPQNLVRSLRSGAQAYVPKERMADIALFAADLVEARKNGIQKHGNWFARLSAFFDNAFEPDWKKPDNEFWEGFAAEFPVTREELRSLL